MWKAGLSVSLAFLGCSNESSATPGKGSAAAPAPKPRPKFEVKSYCGAGGDEMFSAGTGRKGTYFTLNLLVPLEGTETVTEARKPLVPTDPVKEKVGDKTHLRVLMTISCTAFLPESESIAEGLKDEREDPSCNASYLDLAALEAGNPFSMSLKPFIEEFWRIRAIAPGFTSIEIGKGQGENLRVTGLVPFKKATGDKLTTYNTSGTHVSWEYSEGVGGDDGSSRVELAADCPKL